MIHISCRARRLHHHSHIDCVHALQESAACISLPHVVSERRFSIDVCVSDHGTAARATLPTFVRSLWIAGNSKHSFRRRPYRVEYTGSLSTSEVKRRRARLVLGWGTAWEHLRVLSAFIYFVNMRMPKQSSD